MYYEALRNSIKTGDVLLVEGGGLIGKFIRMITAQQASHVGIFLWMNGGLFLADITGRYDFRIAPASSRLKELSGSSHLFHGQAPEGVSGCEEVIHAALEYRNLRPSYSFWSLITVWVAQLLKTTTPHRLVCSTLVESLWARCGYEFSQTPDPGDYFRLCRTTTHLEV